MEPCKGLFWWTGERLLCVRFPCGADGNAPGDAAPLADWNNHRRAWARLPKAYQAALRCAAAETNVKMLADYDAKNPAALARLLKQGVKLQKYPDDVLKGAFKASEELYAEESAKVLDPVTKFLAQSGITVHTRAEIGPAGTTIAKIAEDDKFDLIIMGTHGHGSLGKLVMGSVTTQVLAHCKVPLLIVR